MSSIVESLKHISSKINWLKWGKKKNNERSERDKTRDRVLLLVISGHESCSQISEYNLPL
jgi:hypothetical protein